LWSALGRGSRRCLGKGRLWYRGRSRRHVSRAPTASTFASTLTAASAAASPASISVTSVRTLARVLGCAGCGSGFCAFAGFTDFGPAFFDRLLAFDDRIGHLCGEQTHRAKRVIVSGHDVVDAVRVAVGVDYGDSGDAKFVSFVDSDLFFV
jgi:hypothetical protein